MKITQDHLEKMGKDETIIALQAHLLKTVRLWMMERVKDPAPLTTLEKDMGDTAITLSEEITRLVSAS